MFKSVVLSGQCKMGISCGARQLDVSKILVSFSMKLLIYAIVLTLLLGTWGAWDEPSPSFEIIDSSLFQRVETYRKEWNSLRYPVTP